MSEPVDDGGPVADRAIEIETALTTVRERLRRACVDAGRTPADVALLPVTKFFPASDVRILYRLGCRDFGESREQDASPKVADTAEDFLADPPRWHMIGHLQRNKAKSVAAWAHSIHSVDSARLVAALSKATTSALDEGVRRSELDVILQVSLDGDVHRGGVERDELHELAEAVSDAAGLRLAGLMAVPPLDSEPEAAFADLENLHHRLLLDHPEALELSAGMTGDLEAAVRHGSTCVRVGTAILGARPITSQ
ncbi:YggS family pyridoxal phosphate-dependent enzyme [Rhodococcoides yunnanense]|uniref:Pyridoxal phosphate homeostasis protein n=1 Tax=Rhodococcoides yunnanense TaxID=278209 RepID=A0ABU4BDM5_9NOCA|nr:YggS family pyridoxal phosphate-dependent enzyme [Rhodococcus yunnanensis]MDV6262304.1 YggS family pyridoxal phosphate-dependent enzyme [Rhodococcus yunnanensis]